MKICSGFILNFSFATIFNVIYCITFFLYNTKFAFASNSLGYLGNVAAYCHNQNPLKSSQSSSFSNFKKCSLSFRQKSFPYDSKQWTNGCADGGVFPLRMATGGTNNAGGAYKHMAISKTQNQVDAVREKQGEPEIYPPPSSLVSTAYVPSFPAYQKLYEKSLSDPDGFWREVADNFHFNSSSTHGLEYNFDQRKGDIFIRFMAGARTNIAYNCLERNIARGYGNRVAFHWEGNKPGDQDQITYVELLNKVAHLGALLRAKGVRKGDTVALYLPMILELPVAMLACARIGAVHSVVFAGFSAESLAARIVQGKARVLITADGYYRGNKPIHLKAVVDHAVELCAQQGSPVENVFLVEHLKRVRVPEGCQPIDATRNPIDTVWDINSETSTEPPEKVCPVEWMDSEDPLFVLYTSGSTGAPKGLVHTITGYMCYTYLTCKLTFDAKPETDVFWTTADIGWITGHSYVVYGPLLNGLTSVIFEGVPNWPDVGRFWAIIEKYGVTKFYTAPTAVRSLMGHPESYVTKYNRSSLKVIGTVGEPINPSAWRWLYNVVGEQRCAIVDTYWQTETVTGGHVITALPGATPTKPGSATFPFLGVIPAVLDPEKGRVLEGPAEGSLCFQRAWPGMVRTILGDHDRFVQTYFSAYPGYYFTGDGCRRDEEGYYWITGRVDDMMNVSGHLLSTTEIESALTASRNVVEAAVVATPHDLKGQTPYAFVTLADGLHLTPQLIGELKNTVREKIGAIAIPEVIQEAPGLPKTRSGKITRRILRKIAEGNPDADLGDTSTLVDESVIGALWNSRNTAIAANKT